MPWCQEAMKDVARYDMPRGVDAGVDPWISEWDNLTGFIPGYRRMNS